MGLYLLSTYLTPVLSKLRVGVFGSLPMANNTLSKPLITTYGFIHQLFQVPKEPDSLSSLEIV